MESGLFAPPLSRLPQAPKSETGQVCAVTFPWESKLIKTFASLHVWWELLCTNKQTRGVLDEICHYKSVQDIETTKFPGSHFAGIYTQLPKLLTEKRGTGGGH